MIDKKYEYKRFETFVSSSMPEEGSIEVVMNFLNKLGKEGWLLNPPQVFPDYKDGNDMFVVFGSKEIHE